MFRITQTVWPVFVWKSLYGWLGEYVVVQQISCICQLSSLHIAFFSPTSWCSALWTHIKEGLTFAYAGGMFCNSTHKTKRDTADKSLTVPININLREECLTGQCVSTRLVMLMGLSGQLCITRLTLYKRYDSCTDHLKFLWCLVGVAGKEIKRDDRGKGQWSLSERSLELEEGSLWEPGDDVGNDIHRVWKCKMWKKNIHQS